MSEPNNSRLCVVSKTSFEESESTTTTTGSAALLSDNPRLIIPELMRRFYDLGWFYGSGGALSIRVGDTAYISPSGVSKELVTSRDVYEVDLVSDRVTSDPNLTHPPPPCTLSISTCTPLFKAVYRITGCGCIIHGHALNAVLCTLLPQSQSQSPHGSSTFTISNTQMVKGIKCRSSGVRHKFTDTLLIPVIENGLREEDLEAPLSKALESHPDTSCVLIRHHGFYVFGATWMEAKNMAEAYDYLFTLEIEKRKLGLTSLSNGTSE